MPRNTESRGGSARSARNLFRIGLLGAAAALVVVAPVRSEETQNLDEVRDAVKSFVETQTENAGGTRSVEIDNLDARVRLVRCEGALDVSFAQGSRAGSRRTVGVSCSAPKPWTIYVSARVIRRGEVLVATRNLSRGAVLQVSDLALEERNIEESPAGYLTDANQALGKRTTRPLRLGLPVTSATLEEVHLVGRGQRVWLLAESKSLSVRMSGTALEPGAPGDLIRIQNNDSKKIVQGLVGDDGMIRVGM